MTVRYTSFSAIVRLLVWSGLVLAVFAWEGSAFAHVGGFVPQSVAAHAGSTHASVQAPGTVDHQHAQDQKCGHHGGCMQFAFLRVAGIQPIARATARKPASVVFYGVDALAPLDHPPKFDIAH